MSPIAETSRSVAARDVLGRHLPTLVGLSTLIVAQPLLSVYGDSPGSITAAKLTGGEFVLFALIVVLGPPVVAATAELAAVAVAPRWSNVAHRLTVGSFGLLAGLLAANRLGLSSTVPSALIAALAAVGLAALVTQVPAVASTTRLCSLAAPAVIALALVSPAGAAAFSGAAESADITLDDPPSVVLVVFDELHLASLMHGDGEINADRFPNFARLAQRTTWYRNATSPLARTPEAVPALLSGSLPEGGGAAPVPSAFPRTLLTLLGNTHQVSAYEPATDLCADPCTPLVPRAGFDLDRVSAILEDAGVVYRHQVLPDRLRQGLPDTSTRLAGFTDDEVAPDLVKFYDQLHHEADPDTQARRWDRFVGALGAGSGPEAVVHHALLPHRPWRVLEDGRRHAPVVDDPSDTAPADHTAVRHAHQRHVQQLGQADVLLGRLLDRLDRDRRWDDTIVVVTADHGLSFAVDQPYREPGGPTDADLYRVPLFVHLPDGAGGAVDDCAAETLDIVPTVVDTLGADPGWSFEGGPLADCPSDRGREGNVRVGDASATELPDTVADLLDRSEAIASWYGGTDWPGLYAVGEARDEVGRPVGDLDPRPGTAHWSLDQRVGLSQVGSTDGGVVPATWTGAVEGHAEGEALAVVDGRVAGVAFVGPTGHFRGLVDPEALTPGAHRVGLLVADDHGGWVDLGPPS